MAERSGRSSFSLCLITYLSRMRLNEWNGCEQKTCEAWAMVGVLQA